MKLTCFVFSVPELCITVFDREGIFWQNLKHCPPGMCLSGWWRAFPPSKQTPQIWRSWDRKVRNQPLNDLNRLYSQTISLKSMMLLLTLSRSSGKEGELWPPDEGCPPQQVLDCWQETSIYWKCQHGLEISYSGETGYMGNSCKTFQRICIIHQIQWMYNLSWWQCYKDITTYKVPQ